MSETYYYETVETRTNTVLLKVLLNNGLPIECITIYPAGGCELHPTGCVHIQTSEVLDSAEEALQDSIMADMNWVVCDICIVKIDISLEDYETITDARGRIIGYYHPTCIQSCMFECEAESNTTKHDDFEIKSYLPLPPGNWKVKMEVTFWGRGIVQCMIDSTIYGTIRSIKADTEKRHIYIRKEIEVDYGEVKYAYIKIKAVEGYMVHVENSRIYKELI